MNKRLKLGWFAKPKRCMRCAADKKRLDSHHVDYAKPDEVHWLCRSCHMLAHQRPEILNGIAPMLLTDQRSEATR